MKRTLFLLALSCLVWIKGPAQKALQPEAIDIRKGLSQGFVPCLLQDQEGFIWAGTKNGLNRFDGRSFVVFTHQMSDTFSLSGDFIWAIAAHRDFLLLANNDGILDFFHKKTRRVLHLSLYPPGAARNTFVQSIWVDAREQVWIVAGDRGDCKLYCVAMSPEIWDQLPDRPAALQSAQVRIFPTAALSSAVISPDRKTMYYHAINGVFRLDITTEQSRAIYRHDDWGIVFSMLKMDAKGRVWLGFSNLLVCIQGDSIRQIPTDFTLDDVHGCTAQSQLLVSNKSELLAFDTDNILKNSVLRAGVADWRAAYPPVVLCTLNDRSGNLWLGLDGLGILKFKRGFRQPEHLFPGMSVYGPVFSEPRGVTGFMGTLGLKLTPFNPAHPLNVLANRPDMAHPAEWRMVSDPEGIRWLYATRKSGAGHLLIRLHPDGGRQQFPVPDIAIGSGSMALDTAEGAVWLAWYTGIARFDIASADWKIYTFGQQPPYRQEVYALLKMPHGALWVGTAGGLLKGEPDGKGGLHFQLFQAQANNPNTIPHNAVSCLLSDPVDPAILWIGTKGGGLSRLDTRNGTFKHLNSHEGGLPNDVIYGILPDQNGNLWLSSNKGIIRYTPSTGRLRNFTETDGLQSDEFNTWAYAPGRDGTLMFGGINGLNIFHPSLFEDNPNVPTVCLTGLKINNTPVAPGDSTGVLPLAPEFLSNIDLSYEQNNITLEFAALEYTAPAKNRFRWILEGAEQNWHPPAEGNSATYLNLTPGHYTFKVMAANGDGLWCEQAATLAITIHPPWWRSIWAWLLYGTAMALAARALWVFQTRRRLEQAEVQLLKELDTFKSQLYVNITHEFRTPLTVILGLAREIKNNPDAWPKERLLEAFDPIERNGARLLRLINQMLDLAKLENKALQLDMRRGNAVSYLKYVLESFQSLANARNLVLRFQSPLSELEMDFDPERLAQIVNNLVFNAIKNTPSGGSVFLTVSNPQADRLCMEVRDTGIGIPEVALPHIFERFYQVKKEADHPAVRYDEASHSGTGIGLALTRELVKLMGGDIAVQSKTEGPDRGTCFTVWLPITRQAQQGFDTGSHTSMPEYFLSEAPAEAAQKGADPDSDRPLLLLVEDSADVVDFLRVLLEPSYRVQVAFNGRVGMEMALETIPDVVVSDLMMPEMDGLQLCNALKNDPRSSHIPFVLLTARAAVEDRVAGLSRGADAYLVKPVHREELLVVLGRLIQLRRQLRQRYAQPEAALSSIEDKDQQIENAFLQKLRAVVEQQWSNANLSVEDICRAMGMSHPVLHRKITALTGRSLTLYVRSLRLQRARTLLLDPTLSISEVAYAVGFNDPKFFSRAFSETYGVSPSVFRQQEMR